MAPATPSNLQTPGDEEEEDEEESMDQVLREEQRY